MLGGRFNLCLELFLDCILEQKLDRVMKDKQALDKQRQDKLITALSSTFTTAVNAKLDRLVKSEMKNSVFPGRPEKTVVCSFS